MLHAKAAQVARLGRVAMLHDVERMAPKELHRLASLVAGGATFMDAAKRVIKES